MKNNLTSFLVGFLFSLGLGISGMTLPHKVIGFLNIFGQWDPSLIFVMCGGIIVHVMTYKLILKRKTPVFSTDWHIPLKKEITPALVIGSIVFGIGWGLGGFCPGPAVTSLASLKTKPIIFVISMLIGMFVFNFIDKKFKIKK